MNPLPVDELEKVHNDLTQALIKFGFSRFILIFGIRCYHDPNIEFVPSVKWMPLINIREDGGVPWNGITEDWTNGLRRILPNVKFPDFVPYKSEDHCFTSFK